MQREKEGTPLALAWPCKPCIALPLILVEVLPKVCSLIRVMSVQKRLASHVLPRIRNSSHVSLWNTFSFKYPQPPTSDHLALLSSFSESLTHTHAP